MGSMFKHFRHQLNSLRTFMLERQENSSVDPEQFLRDRLARVQDGVESAVNRRVPVIKGPGGGRSFGMLMALFIIALSAVTAQADTVQLYGCGRPIKKWDATHVESLGRGAYIFRDNKTNRWTTVRGDVVVTKTVR